MKIYSKFTDYYDSALGYGFDKTITYTRHEEVFHEGNDKKKFNSVAFVANGYESYFPDDDYRSDLIVENFMIFFCGKMYPCVRLGMRFSDKSKFCYTEEAVSGFIKEHLSEKRLEEYQTGKMQSLNFWRKFFSKKSIQRLFDISGQSENKIIDLHQEYKIPVMMYDYRNRRAIYNPQLANIQFFKVIDSFQAFQELSMFIGGVLGGQSPKMVQISDNVRIEKHGFDLVTSFRRPKKT